MSSRKEKLLAKKKAEMEALEGDILRNKSKAGKKRRLLPKVLGVAALIFIGGPILLTLTMSPEVKAEMKLERERVEAEKLAAASDKKVETISKSIKRSIETNNYAELKRGIDQLKVLAPEQVSQYAGDVSRVKVASAEKDRNRKLNFTGNYYIGNYVDEFGDKSGTKLVGYRGTGKFSNSATEGSALNFWVAMDSPTKFDIALYEYGGKNPVKDVFGGDAYIIRFRHDDVTGQVTCNNKGDRISCGTASAQKLHAALKIAGRVKFSIYNEEYRTSQYFFTMNANGYTNAMRKLGE